MTLEDALLEKLRTLPVDKQQQVLDFAEFLQQKVADCVEDGLSLSERELALAYQEASGEVDADWDVTVADGLGNEAW